MKAFSFCGIVFLLLGTANQCNSRKCYDVRIRLNNQEVHNHYPVFIDRGMIGYIEAFDKSNEGAEGNICIPRGVKISRDSKVLAGFIKQLGVEGVEIVIGKQADFFKAGEIVEGIRIDSISIDSPGLDSAVSKKLKDIARDIKTKTH